MSRKNWTSDKIFTRLLNNKSTTTYWDNIRELRKRPSEDVYTKAYQLCHSKIDKEKIIGIDVLAQLGFNPRFNPKGVLDLSFKLLEEAQSPKVLDSILSAIGFNNDALTQEQVLILKQFQTHRYSDVRFSLALALSGVEDANAIDILINLSKDKHPEVRDWATFGIGSQLEITNDKIIQALWDRIYDQDTSTRKEAIAGLATRKDQRIKEVLIKELKEIDNYGSSILESIEAFNDRDFIELLEQQIEKNKATKKVNERWLLNSLEMLKTNTNPEA